MPQISVIVPVYKVEKYIHRCVDSILGQTYSDFELILVDDGSPDNCGAICDDYATKDSRVVVIHQENGGLSAARNAGIDWAFANSDSQWLTFIDSDDWVHPEYLERLLDAAVSNRTAVSICGYAQTTGDEPIITPEALAPKIWITEDFFVAHNVNATVAWGKLYSKECFNEIRYPIGKLHEDEFTTYRILFSFPDIVVLQAGLYYYYKNASGIVLSKWTLARLAAYDALEEQITYFLAHHYMEAHRAIICRYMNSIYERVESMSADPNADKQVLRALKKRKRKIFPKYRKYLQTDHDIDAWVLTKVYPKRMWVYWHWKALLRKLRIIK